MDTVKSFGNRKVPSNAKCKCGARAVAKGRCWVCHRKNKKKELKEKNKFNIF